MTVHGWHAVTTRSNAGQVDLPQGALVDLGVHPEPVGLLVVGRVVLDRRADARGTGCRRRCRRRARRPGNGSSEKYSKLRPHSGERFMLMPGPRMTDRLQARASCASASPIRRSRSGFQLEAIADAVGKQVAGSDPPSPTWSPSPGWARSPCGPSDTMILGMPSRSTGAVYQNAGAAGQRRLLLQGQLGQQAVDVECHAGSAFPRMGSPASANAPWSLPRPPPTGRAATRLSAAACPASPPPSSPRRARGRWERDSDDPVDTRVEHPGLQVGRDVVRGADEQPGRGGRYSLAPDHRIRVDADLPQVVALRLRGPRRRPRRPSPSTRKLVSMRRAVAAHLRAALRRARPACAAGRRGRR